jgi:hypothetical protein
MMPTPVADGTEYRQVRLAANMLKKMVADKRRTVLQLWISAKDFKLFSFTKSANI